MSAENDYIVLYRTLVEKKFMLGDGNGKLKQRELEYLANLIEEKSRVKLSISTLKRLWRNELHQLPHPSTLDALVSVLEFNDWQEFKKQSATTPLKSVPEVIEPKKQKFALPVPLVFVFALILLVGAFFLIQGFNKKEKGVVIKKEVVFTADKTVSSGVPNTVMFTYDLSGVEADSFFIQQSWNPRDKVSIDPDKNYYSAIYYTPGFHFARIMANDSILKFQKVHIKTEGWLPLVRYDNQGKKQMSLDANAIKGNGIIHSPTEVLYKANVDLSKDFLLRYYNIRDFDGVTSDNFDLETRVKCDKLSFEGRTSTTSCPQAELMIITEQDVFFIPLTSKGCVGELDFLFGNVYKSGKDNDLSVFGTDVYEWQTLRIRNDHRSVTIFLNGSPVHKLQYEVGFGKIKGFIYTFTGPQSVDYLRLRNLQGELTYADEFDHEPLISVR